MEKNKTVNLEEILKQHNNLYIKPYAVKDCDGNFKPVIDNEGAIGAMKEAIMKVLELATENALMVRRDGEHKSMTKRYCEDNGCEYTGIELTVSSQSILDTIKQIE